MSFSRNLRALLAMLVIGAMLASVAFAQSPTPTPAKKKKSRNPAAAKTNATAKGENDAIGITESANVNAVHTQHPDAQWYPDAGFGLFLHWGIASVKAINISWPMMAGMKSNLSKVTDPAERARIVKELDYDLTGKRHPITPDEYFAQAKDFNPQNYDPDKWCKAIKEAGFTYVVLTTRHHEGFALWPSKFGDFDTKNYMGGKDLLKPFVEACRKYGLKIGFYYSPPDWYFDRDYMNFLFHGGQTPWFPALGPDLKPRTIKHTPEEIAKHQADYAALVKGQVTELLTRYGKIDMIWFDGKPAIPNASNCITQDEIRKMQPGILINPRLHGTGDFKTYERTLPITKPGKGWAELCYPWSGIWSYTEDPFQDDGYVLSVLARCRSLGVNYLLGIGPNKEGEFAPEAYKHMAVIAGWMKQNEVAVKAVTPLPEDETASVSATAAGTKRYLFAAPDYDGGVLAKNYVAPKDTTLTLKGIKQPAAVKMLADGSKLESKFEGDTLTIQLPAAKRTKLVDVVEVDLK